MPKEDEVLSAASRVLAAARGITLAGAAAILRQNPKVLAEVSAELAAGKTVTEVGIVTEHNFTPPLAKPTPSV